MKNFKQQYILERQAGHLLRRARQRHSTIFQENIGDPQLTPLQFAALVKLRDLDEVSQNRLGRLTAMDAATMQGVIKRLGRRGLIVRRPDPKDGRRLIISLSNEGKKTISKLVEFAKNVTNETLAPLSLSERNTFLFLLSKVAELDASED